MKMYLISDNIDTWTGMRLAGVEGAVVHEKQELKAEIDKVLADKEIGILLLTEKIRKGISGYHRSYQVGAEVTADCGNPGQTRHRPCTGFHHILCE